MQDVLDRARALCADDALLGVYERNPDPTRRFAPCQDVFAVCLESSDRAPKAHSFPFVNVGSKVMVGGQVGRIPSGKYKGYFFERGKEPEDKGVSRLTSSGLTKRLVAGTTFDTFCETAKQDRRLFDRVCDLVSTADNIDRMTEFNLPDCYAAVDNPLELIPGRNIDRLVLHTAQFGTVRGVPVAPEAGLVEKHTKFGVILNGTLIRADAGELERRVEPIFGPSSIALYPLPREGEHVKEGQALFTPFPVSPSVQTQEQVNKLPGIRALRWLVLQDKIESHNGMNLAPLSCLSPESSLGEKFLDLQCVRRSRVRSKFNPNKDPLWIKDTAGIEVNFRYTWHRNFILAAERASRQ